MAKARKLPRKQGFAAELAKVFFEPLLKRKPDDMEVEEWLNLLFHVKTRDIVRYRSRCGFKMPGLFMAAGNVAVQGIGSRWVRPGQGVWVRTDEATPNIVHVEIQSGHGSEWQVFQLDQLEWTRTAALLEETPRAKKRLREE